MADWAFGFPTSDWPWMICRCRLDSSTTSNSTMPSVPTPAAARYSRAGLPRPPAPTTRTLAFFSRFCPAMPTSGMMMWREKRRTSSTVSSAAGSTSGGRVTGRLLGSRTTVSCVNPSAPGRVPSAPRVLRRGAGGPTHGYPPSDEQPRRGSTRRDRPRDPSVATRAAPAAARRGPGGVRRLRLPRHGDGRDRRPGRGEQARALPALPEQARAVPRRPRPPRRRARRRGEERAGGHARQQAAGGRA